MSNNAFTKLDTDKPMVSLVEADFILGIADVLTFGAKKYAPNNWKQAKEEDLTRIKDSLLRHTLAFTSGEEIDPESGLSHTYHAACNLMFLDYLTKKFNSTTNKRFILLWNWSALCNPVTRTAINDCDAFEDDAGDAAEELESTTPDSDGNVKVKGYDLVIPFKILEEL